MEIIHQGNNKGPNNELWRILTGRRNDWKLELFHEIEQFCEINTEITESAVWRCISDGWIVL